MKLQFPQHTLDLSTPHVMGILNVTPDSFSDGGHFHQCDAALRQAEKMVNDGAAIIDVGGESTRPGADAVSEEDELQRVIPVIEALKKKLSVPVSIDTSKAAVMRAAVAAGAEMINDVCALQQDGAMVAAAECKVPVCLMHMQGEPRTMQANPHYNNVIEDVKHFLAARAADCEKAGIARQNIVLDPGFGFGKSLRHNMLLLQNFEQFVDLGYPLLAGLSRKSMIGKLLAKQDEDAVVDQRLYGSIAAAIMAYQKGAQLLRVHDVKETVEALKVAAAVNNMKGLNDE